VERNEENRKDKKKIEEANTQSDKCNEDLEENIMSRRKISNNSKHVLPHLQDISILAGWVLGAIITR
jgi:hypothetical protein